MLSRIHTLALGVRMPTLSPAYQGEPMANQKRVVLFIHGFGSSSKCWQPLLDLLNKDERITARYELITWEYPTSWFNFSPGSRIPRLQELGRGLGDRIDSPDFRNREITLVGHSQGGLVIQSWAADVLRRGEGSRLKDIRQIIFFATPSHGSTLFMFLRRLLFTMFKNPQELTLRVLSPDMSDIREVVRQRVVGATQDAANQWRIPVHVFCGMQDGIVVEDSARGVFDSVISVPGNHFTILRPVDCADDRYREFAELLLDPGGHPQRFEIDEYKTMLRIEPRNNEQIAVQSARTPRTVIYDNYATMNRAVRFAHRNRCRNPFVIRYRTQNNGYVIGHTAGAPNIAPSEALGRADGGTEYEFDFIPESGQEYALNVEIYKGYDEGERQAHIHLKGHSFYRHMEYVLDLTAYVAAGYRVTREPTFYVHRTDKDHDQMCNARPAQKPLAPVASDPRGTWRWELDELQYGVVDIVWDIAKGEQAAGPRQ